jgi:hypothetical protein
MSKGENIVKWIKGQKISWLGHLGRKEEDRMPKMIFSQELDGTRRRGRPRKRWKEEVERDLHVLGLRRWREMATDRKKWRAVVVIEEDMTPCIAEVISETSKDLSACILSFK